MGDKTDMQELNFLPSLPMHSQRVQQVICQPQISHRCKKYKDIFSEVSGRLVELIGAPHFFPVISAGCGTFTNEMMLASTVPFRGKNLVLTNGEFGNRLVRQSRVYDPGTFVIDFGFGQGFDLGKVEAQLKKAPEIRQMFFVLSETSAGMMNPLDGLVALAERYDVAINMDAISAIGVMPFDFSSPVFSCITVTSGKALAGVPGISIVYVNPSNMPRTRGISHILDLNFQMDIIRTGENVHHTLSSLLLIALNEALKEVQEHGIAHLHKHYLHLKSEVTKRFSALGLTPLEGSNSPIVTSFRKPNGKTGAWPHISEILAKNKVNVYDNVAYLNEKDLFQIATMGPAYRLDHIEKLEGAFKQALQLSV